MEKTIFVKFSEDRAPEFRIRTRIVSDNGQKVIYKSGIDGKVTDHLRQILQKYEWLVQRYQDSDVSVNEVSETERGMRFEFVTGESLQAKLDRCILQGDTNAAKTLIQTYEEKMLRTGSFEGDLSFSDEEKKIFGNVTMQGGDLAYANNVDMNFPNILVDDDVWNVIDYEWTFNFPIPQKYILYRALLYWKITSGVLDEYTMEEVMSWGDLTDEETAIFRDMECSFQRYIKGATKTFREVAQKECLPQYSLNAINEIVTEQQQKNEKIKVFYPIDQEYSESNAQYVYRTFLGEMELPYEIEVDESYHHIRIDPVEEACTIRFDGASIEGEELEWSHNGVQLSENVIGFSHTDPQIIIDTKGKKGRLQIRCQCLNMVDKTIMDGIILSASDRQCRINEDDDIIRCQQETIQEQQRIIDKLKSMKCYKIYSKARNIKNHIKEIVGV